jgi:vitamin B12 transporter
MNVLLLIAILTQQARTISGVVATDTGEPLRGANVFILETLEGAISDSTGRFQLRTAAAATATLVVQRMGYREVRRPLGTTNQITLVMQLEPVTIPELAAVASRFVTGSSPDAQLTTLEVVSTPGASADVYRALQTFPGLQAVNEGAGLFVRGGDVDETKVYLNESVVLSPYRYESPTGGFFGAFDPFQLDGIHFSSGGFGARYGNALSGVAALESVGKPERFALGATASLAALSGTVSVPLNDHVGVRSTLTRSNTHLMFRVNGTTTDFTHEPEGRDASVIASWAYNSGELRLFAIDQWTELGVFVVEPAFADALQAESRHDAQILSWNHRLRGTDITVVAGHAGARNDFELAALNLTTREQLKQLRAFASHTITPFLAVTVGGELVGRVSRFTGQSPVNSYDGGVGAPIDPIQFRMSDTQRALFGELDGSLGDARAIIGLRVDNSRLSATSTFDPRVSVAYRVSNDVTLTGAWGLYHQIAEPSLHDPDLGGAGIRPMRAEHRILGLQVGADAALFRVEAYQKRYYDLVAFTRDREVAGDGTGSSDGFDVFARWPAAWLGIGGRASYSYIDAKRTDPNTGSLARSPYDITHVLTAVLERSLLQLWQISVSYRYATGRPFTPVETATLDTMRHVWIPIYATPNSERMPAFSRVDVSTSYLIAMPKQRLLVLFVATNNIFDRTNVYDYRYNEDYTDRVPTRSQFKRSVYFGASFTM